MKAKPNEVRKIDRNEEKKKQHTNVIYIAPPHESAARTIQTNMKM